MSNELPVLRSVKSLEKKSVASNGLGNKKRNAKDAVMRN